MTGIERQDTDAPVLWFAVMRDTAARCVIGQGGVGVRGVGDTDMSF